MSKQLGPLSSFWSVGASPEVVPVVAKQSAALFCASVSSNAFDQVKDVWNSSPRLSRLFAVICSELYQESPDVDTPVSESQFGFVLQDKPLEFSVFAQPGRADAAGVPGALM